EQRHRHPLHHRGPAGRARRPRRPARPHPPAPPGTRGRLGLRHPEPLPRRDGRAVAHDVRLACPGGADERVPAVPHRDRRPDDPLRPRAVVRGGRDAAAPAAHLPGLVRGVPGHDRAAHRPRGPRRASRGRVLGGRAVDARVRFLHAGGRPRLDDGPRRAHLRHADAPARLRGLRRPRQRRRRDDLPRAGAARPARAPRPARPAPVQLPVGRPERVRAPGALGLRRPRAHAVVPAGRRLQPDERLAPADRRRRARRLAGRSARLRRAVQQLRQRHEPGHRGADPHPGLAVLADEHRRHGRALPLRGGALGCRAAGQRRADRRAGLRRRLPDDQGVRRARQHEHRPLEPPPPRRALRGDGGAGRDRRRPAGVLRL
ncbi:MAG: Epoxide hydrolase, partial [uncultured Actinomycetospora sp.]